MNEAENLKSIIPKKCSSCYKKDWCMLLPSQVPECIAHFKDVENNLQKIRGGFEREKRQVDKDRVGWEVLKNSFARKKKIFDDRYGGEKKQ